LIDFFINESVVHVPSLLEKKTMSTDRMTTHGIAIDYILWKKNSVKAIIDYMKENNLFQNYEAVERDAHLYAYQIPMDQWTNITGLTELPFSSRITCTDGVLFSYCYYEADYTEHDSPTYLYLSLK
jgi:hypothetical protein